ncbi:MAG: hypothetical protein CMI54_08825 [Parcubacteria group bacterium]|nr:hypothetical protein [Parcubacteria group bacterium]
MTDKLPIEPTAEELQLIDIRETLIKNGMIERIFDPVAKKNRYAQTKQGLITLLAYKELTNDLVDERIPASEDVIADCKKSTEYDQLKKKMKDDDGIIIKQMNMQTGDSQFFPTPDGHAVMQTMLFWIDEQKQKAFQKDLKVQRIKQSMGNWVKEELNPTKILSGMMKASVKMGEVSDGMAKFAGDSKQKPKKRKWSGRKKRKR